MPEQTPGFVVVDKRKFTAEGEIREGFVAPEPTGEPHLLVEPPAAPSVPTEESANAKVVAMPARTPEAASRTAYAGTSGAAQDATAGADDLADEDMTGAFEATGTDDASFEEDGLEPPDAAETAAQDAAYRQSSRELDHMLAQANPGTKTPGVVTFDHVIQSFYLSAIMAMGAGAQPGEKPRIDILGARQAIDMLGVLEEKTRGNLNPQEQQLLQGITFELRMMFLELTNAISKQAAAGPPPGRPGSSR